MFGSLPLGFGLIGGMIAGILSVYAWYFTTTPGAVALSPFVYLILWPVSFVLIGTERMGHTAAISTHVILVICNALMYATIGWLTGIVRGYISRG
jgi:hypothetical protein